MLSQLHGLAYSDGIYCHTSSGTQGLIYTNGIYCQNYRGTDGLVSLRVSVVKTTGAWMVVFSLWACFRNIGKHTAHAIVS